MAQEERIVAQARDISYVKRSYRSFEFVSFEARAGEVLALFGSSHSALRDVLLAVAGLVRPTSGSLEVLGQEISGSSAGLAPFHALRPRRVRAGLGIFDRVAPVQDTLSVEGLVLREMRMRGCEGDALPLLAAMGAATQAGELASRLEPAARARLSAALALVGDPRLAVIDLTDPFVNGLSADAACELMEDLRAYAEEHQLAVVVATSEVRCARAASKAVSLDISAEELLSSSSSEVVA